MVIITFLKNTSNILKTYQKIAFENKFDKVFPEKIMQISEKEYEINKKILITH